MELYNGQCKTISNYYENLLKTGHYFNDNGASEIFFALSSVQFIEIGEKNGKISDFRC